MKKINFKNKMLLAFSALALTGIISCEDDRFDDIDNNFVQTLTVPEAGFTFTIDGQDVTFVNTSVGSNNEFTGATNLFWELGNYERTEDDEATFESTIDSTFTFTFDENPNPAPVTLTAVNSTSGLSNIFQTEILFLEPNFIVGEANERTVIFENTTLSGVSYAWDFGDATLDQVAGTSTEENPTYEFNDFGTFTVSLTATDRFGNVETFVNDDVIVAEPGAGTFRAVIIGGDPDDSSGTSQWAIDPDNSSGYNYWDNSPLEDLVEQLDSGQQKINTSGSVANSGSSSWQIKDPSERFYQAINVEQGVDYTISLFTSSDADAGQTIGTWYVFGEVPPANEDPSVLEGLAIATAPVTLMSDDKDNFEEVTISFNTEENTFGFTDDQLTNNDANLTEGFTEESQFVILYFVPNTTIINEEGNKDDVYVDDIVINTKGF